MNTYIDIGINLTNRQFEGEIDEIIQNALDADVEQMILTGTSVKNSIESEKMQPSIRTRFIVPLVFTHTMLRV